MHPLHCRLHCKQRRLLWAATAATGHSVDSCVNDHLYCSPLNLLLSVMEAIQTCSDHRSYLEENELLFDTLKIIWNNYMQETLSDGGDVDIKVFIYLFYNFYGKTMFFYICIFFSNIGCSSFCTIFNLFQRNCWIMKHLKCKWEFLYFVLRIFIFVLIFFTLKGNILKNK